MEIYSDIVNTVKDTFLWDFVTVLESSPELNNSFMKDETLKQFDFGLMYSDMFEPEEIHDEFNINKLYLDVKDERSPP